MNRFRMLREAVEAAEMNKWNSMFESEEDEKEEKDENDEKVDDLNMVEEPSEESDEDNDSDQLPPEIEDEDKINDEESSDHMSILNNIKDKVHLNKIELELIDGLIEDEMDAISAYSKSLNEVKSTHARKLFTEILNDETKHLAQLKYLRNMSTGDDYIPKNDDANEELAEILEGILEEL